MAIDHFIKHSEARRRTDWNFNILFSDQPQVVAYVKQYKPLLNHPGLYEPVPGKWLHATVLRVGFLEDFTDTEMLTVAEKLEPQLVALKIPQLVLGQWWVWNGNPCLHITPDGPLQEILKLIIEVLAEVVGKNRTPQKTSFTPHITLAYSKTYDDEAGLHRQLESQSIPEVELRANSVSLIKQHVENNYYVWQVIKDLPIGQAA